MPKYFFFFTVSYGIFSISFTSLPHNSLVAPFTIHLLDHFFAFSYNENVLHSVAGPLYKTNANNF